jgi:hypothetical protein
VIFESFQFRLGQRPHSVPFEVFFADVRHEFHGNLFLREIGERHPKRSCAGLRETGLWMPTTKTAARFIEPMLLHRTERLPEGGSIAYELKLTGRTRRRIPLQAVGIGLR